MKSTKQTKKKSPKKPTRKEELEQKIREGRRKVTNQKAAIFDLIEKRTDVLNEEQKLKEKGAEIGQNVLKQQKILDGERKVLKQIEEEYEKLYPNVTVNKVR